MFSGGNSIQMMNWQKYAQFRCKTEEVRKEVDSCRNPLELKAEIAKL